MPYRRVLTLAPDDAGYVAGIIDGEGTITLSRRHARDQRQLVVSVSSTERPILEWVRKQVGAGKITGKRTVSDRHNPGLTYTVSNRQALDLLRQIAPRLRSYKRARAELVLERYAELTPRNGRYTAELIERRRAFEQALLAITLRR